MLQCIVWCVSLCACSAGHCSRTCSSASCGVCPCVVVVKDCVVGRTPVHACGVCLCVFVVQDTVCRTCSSASCGVCPCVVLVRDCIVGCTPAHACGAQCI